MLNLTLDSMGALSIAPRLIAAFVLGTVVGIERQLRQRHTGLTTHALVSLGAAIYTCLPTLLGIANDGRMGGQVVTGIGFIGAGLIMRDGLSVRGLSTAATIWATGGIGVLAGYGMLLEAAEAAIFITLINLVLPRLSRFIDKMAPDTEPVEHFYIIDLKCAGRDEAMVRTQLLQSLTARKLRLHSLESHMLKDSTTDTDVVKVEAVVYSGVKDELLVERLVGEFSIAPHIFSTSWTTTRPQE